MPAPVVSDKDEYGRLHNGESKFYLTYPKIFQTVSAKSESMVLLKSETSKLNSRDWNWMQNIEQLQRQLWEAPDQLCAKEREKWDVSSETTWRLKQKDLRKENKRIGVAVGDIEEKSGGWEEDILPVGGKSKEAADLKKFLKMLENLRPATSKLFK
jgi:hypothetical protein